MKYPVLVLGLAIALIAGQSTSHKLFAAESSSQSASRSIEIGSTKVVILRDSMSADGRNALAWTVDTAEPVDWSLLEKDPELYVIGDMASQSDVLSIVKAEQPDVIVFEPDTLGGHDSAVGASQLVRVLLVHPSQLALAPRR